MDRREFISSAAGAVAANRGVRGAARKAPISATSVGKAQTGHISPIVVEQQCLFPLSAIQLLDGPLARQREANRLYLLKLDPDRLLSCFRQEAGLPPKAPPYRGWESEGLKLWGHILGFYLSGAGYMVQSTGDAELARRLNYITDELHAVQEANGSGYMLAVPGGKAVFRDIAAGKIDTGKLSDKYSAFINGVFEPTYTWNKVTLGLYQSYLATANPRTRDVLIRTVDWFGHDVLDRLTDAQVQALLHCEHGSIHESMLLVYQLTGDGKYRDWARRLCYERMIAPLAAGDGKFLDGYHANCSIPVYTGAERIYQHTGDERLHRAAVNFTNEVIRNRSWVIGGNSAQEHFFPSGEFEAKLHEPAGPESCNSVNMLRLIEAVYATNPDTALIDHYERILWNHMLSSHEPERCMVTYYTPMQPGSYRMYADEFDSMWCCVGTGLECPGKYGQMVYTHGAKNDRVDVNLFVASSLSWPEAGLELRQDTRFPEVPGSLITIVAASGSPIELRIRHPRWVDTGQLRLTVNGRLMPITSEPGGFATIRSTWRKGDQIEVTFPMRISAEMLPGSRNYAAILYGPIVLSASLGPRDLKKPQFWALFEQLGNYVKAPEEQFPAITVPFGQIADHVTKTQGRELTFTLASGGSAGKDQTLIPFYSNHYQRYSIYWRLSHSEAEISALG